MSADIATKLSILPVLVVTYLTLAVIVHVLGLGIAEFFNRYIVAFGWTDIANLTLYALTFIYPFFAFAGFSWWKQTKGVAIKGPKDFFAKFIAYLNYIFRFTAPYIFGVIAIFIVLFALNYLVRAIMNL